MNHIGMLLRARQHLLYIFYYFSELQKTHYIFVYLQNGTIDFPKSQITPTPNSIFMSNQWRLSSTLKDCSMTSYGKVGKLKRNTNLWIGPECGNLKGRFAV